VRSAASVEAQMSGRYRQHYCNTPASIYYAFSLSHDWSRKQLAGRATSSGNAISPDYYNSCKCVCVRAYCVSLFVWFDNSTQQIPDKTHLFTTCVLEVLPRNALDKSTYLLTYLHLTPPVHSSRAHQPPLIGC